MNQEGATGFVAEIVVGGVGLLLAHWFATWLGVTTLWLMFVIDLIGAGVGAIACGLILLGWGRMRRGL